MAFLALPRDHKDIYEAIGYREKLDAVDESIRRYVTGLPFSYSRRADVDRNSEFIDEMIADPIFADMLLGPLASSSASTSTGIKDHAHQHDLTIQNQSHAHDHDNHHDHTHGHGKSGVRKAVEGNRDSEQEKVRSTLRSFVRDWSKDGQGEREACYAPILETLERRWPDREGRGGRKVLIPGSGLGRLAMEVAARGSSVSPPYSGCFGLGSWAVRGRRVRS